MNGKAELMKTYSPPLTRTAKSPGPQSRNASQPEATSLLPESRWFLFLTITAIFFLHTLHNGYQCFRSDHLTQIPLLQMQAEPGLFPRDWFLQKYAHNDVRFF